MVVLFTAAIFVAAFLLFLIQPLAARLVLPHLGGSPAVWTGTMMFFQIMLLAGYGYAHAIARLRARTQGAVHGIVLSSCLLFLPLALPGWWGPGEGPPLAALLLALAASVGVPFFAISSASPLVQAWFSRTGHPRAHDPYFLYAASNAGSLLGLLCYPVVVEPMLGLRSQGWAWAGGYALFLALAVGCWLIAARRGVVPASPQPRAASAAPAGPASPADRAARLRERALWVVLAGSVSSLSLGATQFLTTDIAAVPLLWVLPLSIYLCTFIVAFSRAGAIGERIGRVLLPIAVVAVTAAILLRATHPFVVLAALHMLALGAAGLCCHGRLAAMRPHASRLTEFYLLISAGGALGGVFNAVIAPVVFSTVLEYPLALAACCALLAAGSRGGASARRGLMARLVPSRSTARAPAPGGPVEGRSASARSPAGAAGRDSADRGTSRGTSRRGAPARSSPAPDIVPEAATQKRRLSPMMRGTAWLATGMLGVAVYLLIAEAMLGALGVRDQLVVQVATIAIPCVLAFLASVRPLLLAGVVAALAGQATMFPVTISEFRQELEYVERSFFGVHLIVRRPGWNMGPDRPPVPPLRVLQHGTTLHGQQWFDRDRRFEPLSYYARSGPVGDVMDRLEDRIRRIAVVGLGTGAIAAYGTPQREIDFFEIDPVVARIASNPSAFTFLSDSQARTRIVLGDGRLTLAAEPPEKYDLIVLDAFSSDAIPIHLLTTEAMDLYRSRLAPGGVLLVHISNRHFDLLPILVRAAAHLRYTGSHRPHAVTREDSFTTGVLTSHWVAISGDPSAPRRLIEASGWSPLPPDDGRRPWTDDRANALEALRLDWGVFR